VSETRADQCDGLAGRGLNAQDGSRITGLRVLLDGNSEVGAFFVDDGTEATMEDVQIRETRSRESDGRGGRGLIVQDGAVVSFRRAILDRNRDQAVHVGGDGALLRLEDVVVRDTLERACAADQCEGNGAGDGLGAFCNGSIDVERFQVTGSARCGVVLAHGGYVDSSEGLILCEAGGVVDLRDGEISNNAIGVNIQVEGFDVSRLTDGVVYRDNGIDLDTSELPVPEMASEI